MMAIGFGKHEFCDLLLHFWFSASCLFDFLGCEQDISSPSRGTPALVKRLKKKKIKGLQFFFILCNYNILLHFIDEIS